MPYSDLEGRVAIVTGGTRGIGRAVVYELAREGVKVALCGTREEVAREAARTLSDEHGVEACGYGVDVADRQAIDGMVESVNERFGRVDILVNNAGITRDGLVLRMKDEDFDDVLRVNLGGIFGFTRAVSRLMLRQRSGSIVNLSSVVGLTGNSGQSNYAASKAGILGFTRSVARELASRGIRVNAVAPGFIETDMTRQLPETKREELARNIPLHRLGSPEDVARVVCFLASDVSAYITGQVIQVDGGMVMS